MVVPSPTATPSPTAALCSLRDRQDWAFAQLQQWYLFPELLASGVDPDSYGSVQAYIDALVAPAREQNRDRHFTSLLSIAQNDAFANGGASLGFGFRLSTQEAAGRVFVLETFEGTPALAAGIDRGTEILAIGTGASDLTAVSAIIASEGAAGVTDALGPSTAGLSRLLRVRDPGGIIREVTLAKAEYTLDPVSDRYGALILNDGGKKVGYLAFRVFLGAPAQSDLRAAFAQFRAQGITEVIVDLRYNGGGLNATAELLDDLLLGNRSPSDVMSYTIYRPSKSSLNKTRFFAPQPQSIAATRIAFIGTAATGSASEVMMNNVLPYLGPNVALIGSNSFGKPVGAIGVDRAACDDRLSVIAFANQNRNGESDFYTGLASRFQSTCQATDDLLRPLGDPQEAMIRTALDFLAGRACTPIGGATTAQSINEVAAAPKMLTPSRPSAQERTLPGVF